MIREVTLLDPKKYVWYKSGGLWQIYLRVTEDSADTRAFADDQEWAVWVRKDNRNDWGYLPHNNQLTIEEKMHVLEMHVLEMHVLTGVDDVVPLPYSSIPEVTEYFKKVSV